MIYETARLSLRTAGIHVLMADLNAAASAWAGENAERDAGQKAHPRDRHSNVAAFRLGVSLRLSQRGVDQSAMGLKMRRGLLTLTIGKYGSATTFLGVSF